MKNSFITHYPDYAILQDYVKHVFIIDHAEYFNIKDYYWLFVYQWLRLFSIKTTWKFVVYVDYPVLQKLFFIITKFIIGYGDYPLLHISFTYTSNFFRKFSVVLHASFPYFLTFFKNLFFNIFCVIFKSKLFYFLFGSSPWLFVLKCSAGKGPLRTIL